MVEREEIFAAFTIFSGGDKKEVRYDTVPWAIFTHPQVVHVGVHIVEPQAAILLQPFVYLMNMGYQCKQTKQPMNTKELESLRILCPNMTTTNPSTIPW